MKKINLIQGSPLWHEFRDKHIGSSDISIIMGISPWSSPYKLWEEKLGLRDREPENDAMRRGKELESEALEFFNKQTERDFFPAVFEKEIYPWAACSMDGVEMFDDIIVDAVEIKACGPKIHSQLMEGDIPDYYLAQMNWQMMILELPRMYLFAYSPDFSTIIKVERDEEYIYKMIDKAREFWECIVNRTPPALTDKDWKIKDDLEWSMKAAQWKDAKAMLFYYETKEAALRQELIKQAEDSNSRGGGIRLTKVVRSGNIDYPKLVKALGFEEEAEKYRKEATISYRITNDREEL